MVFEGFTDMPLTKPSAEAVEPPRSWALGLRRGAACKCPNCGAAPVFAGFLRVRETCAACGHALGSYRADDAPPYFTIFIVGHVIVAAMLVFERMVPMPMWAQAALWMPATLALTFALMRPVKGAVLGVMWANRTLG